jgi:hypothetical protein
MSAARALMRCSSGVTLAARALILKLLALIAMRTSTSAMAPASTPVMKPECSARAMA